ncbi:MAG: glycosyltransferase [Patescibacteria group bacterium]|jgi:glycosyltransferase involved in cell wall biosynthesis
MSKILLISHYVPPVSYGGPIVLYRLFKSLPKNLYAIFTSMPAKNVPIDPAMTLPGAYHYSCAISPTLPYTRLRAFWEWLLIPCMIIQCLVVIKKEKIGKIIVCPSSGTFLLMASVVSVIWGIPLYLYMLDLFEENKISFLRRFFSGPIEHMAMKIARGIFVMSETMKEHYFQKYNLKTTLLRHPFDKKNVSLETKKDMVHKRRTYKIIYTGMIYEAQLDAIINLSQAVRQIPQVEFHVYTPRGEKFLNEKGVIGGNNIFYHGFLNSKNMPTIQKDADILFLPMAFKNHYPEIIKTASPVKLAEYLSSGRPILVHAPAYAYISWYARKYGWGIVVDRPVVPELREAILKLISDVNLQRVLIEKAQETALMHDTEQVLRVLKEKLDLTVSDAVHG